MLSWEDVWNERFCELPSPGEVCLVQHACDMEGCSPSMGLSFSTAGPLGRLAMGMMEENAATLAKGAALLCMWHMAWADTCFGD